MNEDNHPQNDMPQSNKKEEGSGAWLSTTVEYNEYKKETAGGVEVIIPLPMDGRYEADAYETAYRLGAFNGK